MSRESAQLCSPCSFFKNAWQTRESPSFRVALAPDFITLRESARAGCQLCQIVHQGIVYSGFSISLTANGPISLVLFKEAKNDIFMNIDTESYRGLRVKLDVLTGQMPTQSFGDHKPITNLTSPSFGDTDYSIDGIGAVGALAKRWISVCRLHHSECKRSQSTNHSQGGIKLPTRLIDVGVEGDELAPKLIITATQALGDTDYLALSYAWGFQAFSAKLTASRVEQMMEGIDVSELPKTIRHAVIFARTLGVRYLWVDALCIIQAETSDDAAHRADWQHEADRFGQYYENALLTIAATGADGSDIGLFTERPALEFNPEPLFLGERWPSGPNGQSVVFPSLPQWSAEVENSLLYMRGWATQERLLSRRILHFATNCVSWECRRCRATEASPEGVDLAEDSTFFTDEMFVSLFKDLKNTSFGDIMKHWAIFVGFFLLKDFTFKSDRLPALSGIAAMIQARFQINYFAGIWESHLLEGLSWMVLEPDFPEPANTESSFLRTLEASARSTNTVPSWSWASLGGNIAFLS